MKGPSRSTLGSMAARINPPLHVPYPTPEPTPLRKRMLKALAKFPRTTCGLASELDVKELLIIQTLACMAQEGLVEAGAIPASGRRDQSWRVV